MCLGSILSVIFVACGSGSKFIDFTNYPKRSAEFSPYFKCQDNDTSNACKNVCTKYKRDKKTCKKSNIERINISDALNKGYILISKAYYLKLINPK
jgi:hypothetical protein